MRKITKAIILCGMLTYSINTRADDDGGGEVAVESEEIDCNSTCPDGKGMTAMITGENTERCTCHSTSVMDNEALTERPETATASLAVDPDYPDPTYVSDGAVTVEEGEEEVSAEGEEDSP
ncbi:hypothetical protein JNK13_02580 [bacterium]|nr:hypothetical protein [bacterium]